MLSLSSSEGSPNWPRHSAAVQTALHASPMCAIACEHGHQFASHSAGGANFKEALCVPMSDRKGTKLQDYGQEEFKQDPRGAQTGS